MNKKNYHRQKINKTYSFIFDKILYLCNIINKMSSKRTYAYRSPLFIKSTILILFPPFT